MHVIRSGAQITFFFLIGNKDLYSRTLPYAKKHKAERKLQRERKITKRKLQKTRVYVNYINI